MNRFPGMLQQERRELQIEGQSGKPVRAADFNLPLFLLDGVASRPLFYCCLFLLVFFGKVKKLKKNLQSRKFTMRDSVERLPREDR